MAHIQSLPFSNGGPKVDFLRLNNVNIQGITSKTNGSREKGATTKKPINIKTRTSTELKLREMCLIRCNAFEVTNFSLLELESTISVVYDFLCMYDCYLVVGNFYQAKMRFYVNF